MENKEIYSPKEIAEYIKVAGHLKYYWNKLGNSENSKNFKSDAIGFLNSLEEYKIKIPKNIRDEIGLNPSKVEKICEKIILDK